MLVAALAIELILTADPYAQSQTDMAFENQLPLRNSAGKTRPYNAGGIIFSNGVNAGGAINVKLAPESQ